MNDKDFKEKYGLGIVRDEANKGSMKAFSLTGLFLSFALVMTAKELTAKEFEEKYGVKVYRREANNGSKEELDISGQIKLIVANIGKTKIATLLILLFLFFLFMAVFVGIGLAIIGELIIIQILIISAAPFISLKKIPNMYVGVPLIFGKRNDYFILNEGWAIVINGIFDYIAVNVKTINLDFSVTVHSSDRFQVILSVLIMIRVNKNKVHEFLDASGRPEGEKEGNNGVADRIIAMGKSSLTISSKNKTAKEILALSPEIRLNALKEMTGEESFPSTVPRLGITLIDLIIKERGLFGNTAGFYDIESIEKIKGSVKLSKTDITMKQIQKIGEEFKKFGQPIDYSSIYYLLKEHEQLEKGNKIIPGLNKFLNSFSYLEIREIIRHLKYLKGGKE